MMKLEKLIEQEARHISSDGMYSRLKKKAWEQFLSKGLPQKKHEEFRYFPLVDLYDKDFSFQILEDPALEILRKSFPLPQKDDCRIVFINGAYCKELSVIPQDSLQILSFEEALKVYGSFIQAQWAGFLKFEKNPFSLLNAALHQKAAFVYLAPNCSLDDPLKIYHLQSDNQRFFQPRLHIFCAKNSSLELKFISDKSPKGSWSNQSIDIFLEAGSRLRSSGFFNEEAQQQFRVLLKKDAHAYLSAFSKGGEIFSQTYDVRLLEEGASVCLEGANYLNGNRRVHQNCFVEHQAPNCRSEQRFKNVLDENSHASFQAKTYIHPQAQQSDAMQLNENLLLSDEARIDTVPNLEIFADDVSATHGATIAQIDEEKLQYLQSRGLAKDRAENFLVRAFLKEVQVVDLQKEFEQYFDEVFHGSC